MLLAFLLNVPSTNVPQGTYLLEVQSPQYTYPTVRFISGRGLLL
jgi:hypothetical protein